MAFIIGGCGHSSLVRHHEPDADQGNRLIEDLRVKLAQDPVNTRLTFSLAMACKSAGDLDAALTFFDSTLHIDSVHTRAKIHKADLFASRNQQTDAFTLYLEVLRSTDDEKLVAEIAELLGQPYSIYRLTSADYNNAFGSYSPDGATIVYQSDRSGNWDIYTMSDRGTNDTLLISDEADEELAVFSHDGRYIAYTSNRCDSSKTDRMDQQRDIWIFDKQTKTTIPVVRSPYDDWFPSFTDQHHEIVFVSERDDPRDVSFDMKLSELYIVNTADDITLRLTQNDDDDGSPSVSRNGRYVLYTSNPDSLYQIYQMDLERNEISGILKFNGHCGAPYLSFDRNRMTFFAKADNNYDIFEMNMINGRLRRLTNHQGIDAFPRYSPDRRRILFHSNRDGKFQIYFIDLTEPVHRTELIEEIESKL